MATLLKLVFPVVFNLCFFLVLGLAGTSAQWCSWLFINIAYGAFMYTLREPIKERLSVLSFTLYLVGLIYFGAALVVGLVFMVLLTGSVMGAAVSQIVLLGLFIVVLVSSQLANHSTEQSLAAQRAQGQFLLLLQSGVNACLDRADLPELRHLATALEVSPLQSSAAVAPIEQELLAQLNQLQAAVAAQDSAQATTLAAQMLMQLKQRNALLQGSGV